MYILVFGCVLYYLVFCIIYFLTNFEKHVDLIAKILIFFDKSVNANDKKIATIFWVFIFPTIFLMPILQFLKFTLSKTFKNKPFFLDFQEAHKLKSTQSNKK